MSRMWYRMRGEPDKAFEAFSLYRDMGPGRTQSKVCKKHNLHTATICRWSRKYDWAARVDAYDNNILESVQHRVEEKIIDKKVGYLDAIDELMYKGMQRLINLNFDELKPNDVVNYIEKAIKLKREILGEDVKKVDVSGGITLDGLFNLALSEGYIKPEKEVEDNG